MAGDYSTVGRDLVNHCVNDILVQGARPLFFLDYVGAGTLDPRAMEQLVRGVADGYRENGCALLGGETAEMPGFYQPGDYELVGFVVGLVDRKNILDGSRVRQGDLILGLPAAGLHTNGYSLARRVFFGELGLEVGDRSPEQDCKRTVGELLLAPHRSYLSAVEPLLGHPGLHALAHITGGGLTDNLPRVLPRKSHAQIKVGAWEIPEVFHLIQKHGGVDNRRDVSRLQHGRRDDAIPWIRRPPPTSLARLRDAKQKAVPIGTVQGGGSGVGLRSAANRGVTRRGVSSSAVLTETSGC